MKKKLFTLSLLLGSLFLFTSCWDEKDENSVKTRSALEKITHVSLANDAEDVFSSPEELSQMRSLVDALKLSFEESSMIFQLDVEKALEFAKLELSKPSSDKGNQALFALLLTLPEFGAFKRVLAEQKLLVSATLLESEKMVKLKWSSKSLVNSCLSFLKNRKFQRGLLVAPLLKLKVQKVISDLTKELDKKDVSFEILVSYENDALVLDKDFFERLDEKMKSYSKYNRS